MARLPNALNDYSHEPCFLEKLGFELKEEDSTDTIRSVWYNRVFQTYESQVKLVVQVVFEQYFRDDPEATYDENVTYSFSQVNLIVVDRKMDEFDNGTYDEDSEKPHKVGRLKLDITKVSELKALCKMLTIEESNHPYL